MQLSYRPFVRSLEDQLYFDKVVAELRAKNPPKPKPVKPEGMSQEDFIISLQSSHTQRVLKMNEAELQEYQSRLNPENWEAVPGAKTIEERIGQRDLDLDEISHIESIRRRPKNSTGQSEKAGASKEAHSRAIEAIIYTPGARVSKEEVQTKAVNLIQYKSEPLKEQWVEIPWYKALMHRLRGNKIRSETKK